MALLEFYSNLSFEMYRFLKFSIVEKITEKKKKKKKKWQHHNKRQRYRSKRRRRYLNVSVLLLNEPRQANLVLIGYARSEGSGEPAHPRSLARTSAARSYKQWVMSNHEQTESQIPSHSEWLGMRS